jgi:SAM-dependent methyltransferase
VNIPSHDDGDPLAGSLWSRPATVAGFAQSAPNETLLRFAAGEKDTVAKRLLDIGCGAGRNTVPLARLGWNAIGVDLSLPMIAAAAARVRKEHLESHLRLAFASMHELPFAACSFDFIVAHGIWNLARSGSEFRHALAEAARVARPRSALFVFTFSRNTLPPDAQPIPNESFVFTQFSGQPQCFLTAEQLVTELKAVGFVRDPLMSLRELNLPKPGALSSGGAPVIYEGIFRCARVTTPSAEPITP